MSQNLNIFGNKFQTKNLDVYPSTSWLICFNSFQCIFTWLKISRFSSSKCYTWNTKVKSINILDIIIFIFNLYHNFWQVIGTLKTLIELWLPFSLYIYAAEILRFSSYYHITRNIEYQTFFKYRRFHIFTFIFGNKDSFVFYHILFTPFLFNKDILKILR